MVPGGGCPITAEHMVSVQPVHASFARENTFHSGARCSSDPGLAAERFPGLRKKDSLCQVFFGAIWNERKTR
jgi:hypothetical protein